MPKIFGNLKSRYVQSEEILRLIGKANNLTDGDGYQLYDDNAESLDRILDRILMAAKQEEEWYCYFYTLFEMLYLLYRKNKYKKMLRYAEVFYRDSELYMDTAVSNYPDTDIGEYSTWSYNMIFGVYVDFSQITDDKMEEFIERYRESIRKYGGDKSYYGDMLQLALLYRDEKAAKPAKEGLEQSHIGSCYLCAMRPVLGYYLLCEDYENLEHMIFEIRTRQIPAKHRWCYAHCYLAEDKELIKEVLGYCLILGRSQYFHKLLEENKRLFQIKEDDIYTLECYCYGYLGIWENLSVTVKRAEDDVEDWKKGEQSPLGYIYDCLSWYCYFTKLDMDGIHEVATELAGREVQESKAEKDEAQESKAAEAPLSEKSAGSGKEETAGKKCRSLDLAAYFEKEADKTGAQMEASRKKFDYGALKKSYKECIDI